MADTRGVVMRGRPRGAAKVKVQLPTKGHSSSSSAHPVMLPRLKPSPSNNHSSSREHLSSAAPFSPRAREIPIALPIAPHPPTPSSASKSVPPIRPTAPSPTLLSEQQGFSSFEPASAKTAWSTPRSPVPEITDSPTASLSALASFFKTDGTTPTPSRLLAVEESLLTAEQLYRVDWSKLQSDTEKFMEIASTATQHVDAIQAELPAFQASNDDFKAALGSLSQDIESLHDQHAAERDKMFDQMDQLFAQQTDERIALVEAHSNEKLALEEAHQAELESLKADFNAQIQDIQEQSAKTESNCLEEIAALKERMASELQRQSEQAQAELEQLRTTLTSAKNRVENELQSEIQTLREKSNQELSSYREASETAYQELMRASQEEIRHLKESSALEVDRVLRESASALAEVTEKLTTRLKEVEEASASEISKQCSDHAEELNALKQNAAATVQELRDQHAQEIRSLNTELESQIKDLNQVISDAKRDHDAQVQEMKARFTTETTAMNDRFTAETKAMHDRYTAETKATTARYTAEVTTTKATMAAEIATLVKHHTQEVERMRAVQKKEMADSVESYEKHIRMLNDQFTKRTDAIEHEARVTKEVLVQDYETQLRLNQESFRNERDGLVLQYETELSFLRRATAEQVDKLTSEHEATVLQMRQGHALRVLSLETNLRDQEKVHQEEDSRLKEQLTDTQRRLNESEMREHHLRLKNDRLFESSSQERTRMGMQLEEMEAAIAHLEHTNAEKDVAIDSLRRELKSCEDECQTKSNTIMELTFVIKSRDEEIEKLHSALLDSIQNANSKNEILEITAESLSTKAKELEDARAALRLETGRLSIIEEDMHQKAGMLEDSELKIENMRLQMENLRLEMKRLQMDMKLQHEHSAGEMELKQGEIRRLYASQVELKQRNDMQQETIVQLEAALATSQKQGDETRRRMELLRVEATQYLEDTRKLGDQLLGRDREVAVLTKDRQDLQTDKQRLHIQLNNLQSFIQVQREKLARTEMLLEDVHCQYQRRLEMSAAEKDERLRHERHLLLLELGALKESLRHYQDVEKRLQDSQSANASLIATLTAVREERQAVAADLQLKEALLISSAAELSATREAHSTVRERLELDIRTHVLRIEELEQAERMLKREVADKEALLVSVSSGASSLSDLLRQKDEQLADLERELSRIRTELDDARRMYEQDLQINRAELDDARKKYEQDLEWICTELDDARKAHEEDINAVQTELDDARKMHEQELEKLRLSHGRDLEQLERASQFQNDQLQETIDSIQQELRLKQEQLDTARVTAQEELASLQQSHEQALQELRSVFESDQVRLEASNRAEVEQLRHDIAIQEAKVNEKDLALSEAQELIANLRGEIRNCESRIVEKEDANKALKETWSVKCVSHLQELQEAEQRLKATTDEYQALIEAGEARFEAERRELAKTSSAHQEANMQIAYLVKALKQSEDASRDAVNKVKETLHRLQTRHNLAEEQFQDALTQAQVAHILEVTVLMAEIEAVRTAHQERTAALEKARRESLECLEAAKMEEIQAVQMELTNALAALRASKDDELNRALLAREQEHASHIHELESSHERNLDMMKTQLKAAQEALSRELEARAQAQTLGNELSERVEHLKQKLEDKQRELDESLEVIRTRNATIESVRKEMALLMEMHKQMASVVSDNNREPHPDADQPETSVVASGPPFQQFLQLVKQQVKTYVTEEFHIEAVPTCDLGDKEDLSDLLKDLWRMRCCLAVSAKAPVLSVGDVCDSVRSLYSVASAVKSEGASPHEVERSVLNQLRDLNSLLASVVSVTGVSCSTVDQTIEALSAYTPLFNELKQFTLTVEEDSSSSAIHVARNAALVAILKDHRAMQEMEKRVVESAKDTIGASYTKISDILPLFYEAQHLLRIVEAIRKAIPLPHQEQTEHSQSNYLQTGELSAFVQAKRQFEDELARGLGWTSSSIASNAAMLDAVRSIMRVVHAFDFLDDSKPCQDDKAEHPLGSRTQEIVRFVEELKTVSEFAQNILDEEADATQSHSSSTSSLLSLRATLTRTPTPTSDIALPTAPTIDDASPNAPQVDDIDEQLFLSEDALAPPNEDTLRACPSGALSESLMDISLVMNDHYRIISEAAHWVNKAKSLSPRRKSSLGSFSSPPSDFPSEITQLVRDHCSLLSLSRRLFRLQDPRQDLPTVLECLAVLARLTSRLGFFDLSMQGSDSSASLNSATSESQSESSHKKLKAALSVFSSMEVMARHLQDYDSFIGRFIRTNRHLLLDHTTENEDQSPITSSIENAEALAERITERLTVVENLKTQLGLENVSEELLAFVTGIRSLAEDHTDVSQTSEPAHDWVLQSVRSAFEDSSSYHQLLQQLRETMPFSSTAETPNELVDQLKEILAQSDTLISARDQAMEQVSRLTDEINRKECELGDEEKLIGSALAPADESSATDRNEKLARLIKEFHTVQAANTAMALSISEEEALLQEVMSTIPLNAEDSEDAPTSSRLTSIRRLVFTINTLQQEKLHLEASLETLQAQVQNLLSAKQDIESLLQEERKKFQEAAEEEEDFLCTHSVVWNVGESRIPVYEMFLRERSEAKTREHEAKAREEEQAKRREEEAKVREQEEKARQQEADEMLKRESEFLSERGFCLLTGNSGDVVASRLEVYKTLLSGQQLLIEEKMERELEDEQERAKLEAEGVHIGEREEIVRKLLDARNRVEELEKSIEELTRLHAEEIERQRELFSADMLTERKLLTAEVERHKEELRAKGEKYQDAMRRKEERHLELLRQYEILPSSNTPQCLYSVLEDHLRDLSAQRRLQEEEVEQEKLFLIKSGLSDARPCLEARRHVYETLLEREAAAQQALRAWDGSPHTNGEGCVRAEERHRMALATAEKNYAEAIERAVASASAKQAAQIGFQRAVYDAEEETSASSPFETATEVIAAITKRDNAAISMIYRLIRLSTDILNTSAFANVQSPGGGELPVELTQSVLACVKELKSLKEYLLQSLEQIVKDARCFVPATVPSSILQENPCDRDATIDFSVLLHREFVSSIQKLLSEKDKGIQETVDNLKAALVAHAGVLGTDEAKRLEMEVDAAREVTKRQQVETRCEELEAYVRHLSEERKQVEAALRQALQESRKIHEELIKKTQTLEQERSDAIAQAVSMGLMVSSATPRTSAPIGISRGYTAATNGIPVVPMRPDRPREQTASSTRLKTGSALGTGTAHKERFVSDLEKETGQRRSTMNPPSSAASQRRTNDWKRHELLSSSMQIEQQFRALSDDSASPFNTSAVGGQYMTISPPPKSPTSIDRSSLADQELWYQGVRMLQHVSFFVSVFFVPKQRTFRVEIFNSDTEQQQTIYVTLDEMRGFLAESRRAAMLGVALEDPTKHGEVVDVLFERVRVLGSDSSNMLFSFQ